MGSVNLHNYQVNIWSFSYLICFLYKLIDKAALIELSLSAPALASTIIINIEDLRSPRSQSDQSIIVQPTYLTVSGLSSFTMKPHIVSQQVWSMDCCQYECLMYLNQTKREKWFSFRKTDWNVILIISVLKPRWGHKQSLKQFCVENIWECFV